VPRPDLTASFFGGDGFTLYHAWGNHGRVPLSPHFHDEYLICAQIRGHEECLVGGRPHEFSPGDVVLINPQQVHTGNTLGEEVEYVSLYVDRELVERLAAQMGAPSRSPEFTLVKAGAQAELVDELRVLLQLMREHAEAPLYPTPQAPPEEDVELPGRLITNREGAEHPEPTPVEEDLSVEGALTRVLTHAFEEFSNLRAPRIRSSNRIGHRKIARAVDFIRELPSDTDVSNVSLDELARVAGLSKYHFLRQFDQVVGMTPGAYLRTLRLCHAGRMLRTTEKPILDIALAVGFADHPSFSRAFARHMGMTPSAYRKLGPL
jgi:AraC-like DNA-binding protein